MASVSLKRVPPWGWAAGAVGLLWLFSRDRRSDVLVPSLARARKPPSNIASVLRNAARAHGVPFNLLTAVAYVESRYDPTAGSPKGAVGLLQLMPRTAEALGVRNRLDPQDNAYGGAKFLAQLRRKYGNWEQALAAYNWGPGNVNRNPEPEQWPKVTQTYVGNVLFAKGRVA